MQLHIERAALKSALDAQSKVVGGPVCPAWQCVLLAASDDRLELYSMDGMRSLRQTVYAVDVATTGQALVPMDRLRLFCQSTPDTTLSLSAGEDCALTVAGDTASTKLNGRPPGDIPEMPVTSDGAFVRVPADRLAQALSEAAGFMAATNSQHACNGALLDLDQQNLNVAATDGRTMYLHRIPVSDHEASDGFTAIIPSSACGVLSGWSDEGEQIMLRLSGGLMAASIGDGDGILKTHLVEGHFPPYRDVIPRQHKQTLRVQADSIIAAVRVARTSLSDTTRTLRLDLKAGQTAVGISAQSVEIGSSSAQFTLEEPAAFDLAIGFSDDVLLRSCAPFAGGEPVSVSFSDHNKCILVKRDDTAVVAMPMRLP